LISVNYNTTHSAENYYTKITKIKFGLLGFLQFLKTYRKLGFSKQFFNPDFTLQRLSTASEGSAYSFS